MKTKPLTDEQWPLVMAAIDCPKIKLLFYLGIKTGLRVSELLSIKAWQLDSDVLNIERKNVKGKRASRSLYLNSNTQKMIIELKNNIPKSNCEYLFPCSRFHIYRELKNAAKKAGINCNLGTHGMRKTFAKKVYELSSKDLLLTKIALGHVSINSTIQYLELENERLNSVLGML